MRIIVAFILTTNLPEDNDEKHDNAGMNTNCPLLTWDGHIYLPVVHLNKAEDRETAVACAQRFFSCFQVCADNKKQARPSKSQALVTS